VSNFGDNSIAVIALVTILAFLPLIAVTVTAFAKVSVVMMIVRNAIGLQQLPPNVVMYGLAVILSVYVAVPIVSDAYQRVQNTDVNYSTVDGWYAAGETAAAPLQEFLRKHTDEQELAIFLSSTKKIWGPKYQTPRADDLTILVPAFLLTELTKAFEIGFMLYLPFVAIDIIVTAILIALGMMMVPPSTIAIPFKLMLFILVGGWTKVVQGLLLTYS
jgi:type III secretion protein R